MYKIKETIFKELSQFHKDGKLSKKVFTNTLLVLNRIYTDDLTKVNIGDINHTKYGTSIIEWDIGEKLFSLEVGKSKMGYFIEVGGKDIKQEDSLEVTDPNDNNILQNDITFFINYKINS